MVRKVKPVCLVVEPEAGMRMLLDDLLSTSQVEVLACDTDNQALDLLKNHEEINVILMPAPVLGTKSTLVAKVRKEFAKLPIVCLSHSSSLPDRAYAFEQGASDYMVRPVSPISLAEKITGWAPREHRKNF